MDLGFGIADLRSNSDNRISALAELTTRKYGDKGMA